MNKRSTHRYILSILVWILVSSVFQDCVGTNKIIEENDPVYSAKRISLKYICRDADRRSPLLYLEQSIVKEIQPNKKTTYNVYDILVLNSTSFKLENKVFLIVDNDVFPMTLTKVEYENSKTISENRSDVMTSDSTSVSVVTGYSENNRKITRFSYELSDKIINRIKTSSHVALQYYAGPSMLTVKLKDKNLKKLKELILAS